MSDPIVFGFPRSTFVQIVRLVLTHKNVSYSFRDLEPEMGKPTHLALHPFNRVPILQHGDFTVYETSAIVNYVEETFDSVALRPTSPRERARMDQWISAVNSYYYPYMIYHVSHERRVFPELGIPSDEKVVEHALPKIGVGLQVAGAGTGRRAGLSTRFGAYACRLLPPAEYLRFRPDPRGQVHVSEISGLLPMAGADGGLADRATLPCCIAAAHSDRACAGMGGFASTEILNDGFEQAGTNMIDRINPAPATT